MTLSSLSQPGILTYVDQESFEAMDVFYGTFLDTQSEPEKQEAFDELIHQLETVDSDTRALFLATILNQHTGSVYAVTMAAALDKINLESLQPIILEETLFALANYSATHETLDEIVSRLNDYDVLVPEDARTCLGEILLAKIHFLVMLNDPSRKGPKWLNTFDEKLDRECDSLKASSTFTDYVLSKSQFLYSTQRYTSAAEFIERNFEHVNVDDAMNYYAMVYHYTEILRINGMSLAADEICQTIDWEKPLLNHIDSANYAIALSSYATVRLEGHGLEEALELSETAVNILEQIDTNLAVLPGILINLATFHIQMHQSEKGLERIDQAIRKLDYYVKAYPPEVADQYHPLLVRAHLGKALWHIQFFNDFVSAASSANYVEDHAELVEEASLQDLFLLRSFVAMSRGKYNEALEFAKVSLDKVRAMGISSFAEIPTRTHICDLLLLLRRPDPALVILRDLKKIGLEHGDMDIAIQMLAREASLRGTVKDFEGQANAIKEAQDLMIEYSSFRAGNQTAILLLNAEIDMMMYNGNWDGGLMKTRELSTLFVKEGYTVLPTNHIIRECMFMDNTGLHKEAISKIEDLADQLKDNLGERYFVEVYLAQLYSSNGDDKKAQKLSRRLQKEIEASDIGQDSRWRDLIDNLAYYNLYLSDPRESLACFKLSREYDVQEFEELAQAESDYLDQRFMDSHFDEFLYFAWKETNFEGADWILDYRLWAKSFIERTTSETSKKLNLINKASEKSADLRDRIRKGDGDEDELRERLDEVEGLRNSLLSSVSQRQKSADVHRTLRSQQCVIDVLQYAMADEFGYLGVIYHPNGEITQKTLCVLTDTSFSTRCREFMFPDSVGLNLDVSKEIYNLIWRPMEEDLINYRQVFWSTSGLLSNLNPGVLFDEEEGIYLASRHEFSIVTDVSNFDQTSYAALNENDIVVIGDPNFGGNANTTMSLPFLTRAGEFGSWLDLDGAEKELRLVDSLGVSVGFDSRRILGNDATEETFLNLDSPHILHVATHGFYLEEAADPYNACGLVFQGANDSEKSFGAYADDNYASAAEIMDMDLSSTALVILSACETAQGSVGQSENYNLVRAFKIAGAESVIASGWLVHDGLMTDFMSDFYNFLGKGMEPRQAFTIAQSRMREKHPDPYLWGVFKFFE